jgi:chemotaxis protein histidine kinase CheA
MNKAHSAINWENYPSDETPLNESNLNKMDAAIGVIDDRVITLDTTKATKTEVATLVADVTFEESTGIITITKKNGSKITIDTQMEKIAINFDYNPTTQQIILTLIDGTKQYIDLSALITQYEFLDSDTVAFYIDKDGKVSAIVKEGSIEEKHLEPNYLAKIKVEVAKAESSQQAAAKSEANAKASENAAKASETAAKTSETNAKASETAAAKSATAAEASESNAKVSETSASESSATATEKASSASQSADTAAEKADIATQKAAEIIGKAESAEESATKAQSYAVGGTGSREGEDFDNAKYYYQQAKDISEGLKGGLQPHGTVAFADLPALADVSTGWMFNISDEFTTTDDFKEGAGNVIPAGANIYKTSDEKWDVLAGTPVTGIKGVNEDSFRRGNVVLTAKDVGAVSTGGDTAENTTAFTAASVRENLKSGESHATLFGKIVKWFSDLKTVAFSGSYNDLSNKPTIPTVVNNNTTTEAGYALDARQANPNVDGSLAKQISTLNRSLALRPVYPLYIGKTAVWSTRDDLYEVTADGYIQFWYNVDDDKHDSNCGINGFIDGVLVYEYFEYHQAGAANENYSPMFPVLKGQTANFHIITDSVLQYATIYHYPVRA